MTRAPSLEETLRELEEAVRRAGERLQALRRENAQLRARLERLESNRGQLRERVNIMLDRIESLG